MDPKQLGDVKIELLDSKGGSGGIFLVLILLKSNELNSLMRQEIGWSSSECTYLLKSRGQNTADSEGVADIYKISISFSVVPNRISRRKGIFDDSVLHASWGGIRAFDMTPIGSKLLCTKPSNDPSAENKWGNHLLFRSGQAILGLPEKDSDPALGSKVFVLTIIAVQHLPRFIVSEVAKIYCLITSSSAKQVSCIFFVFILVLDCS